MKKIRFVVAVSYTTVKGISMHGKKFEASAQTDTHVELYVTATGERVSFARSELL